MAEPGTTGNRRAGRSGAVRNRRSRPSRDEVAEAALHLLEREGLEALTVRRVAAEVGIPPTNLYGYFRGKDELVDAVINLGARRSPLPEVSGHWRAQIGDLMRWL